MPPTGMATMTPGSELKIEHSVVCENVDISTLITMEPIAWKPCARSIDGEQKAYEIVVAAARQLRTAGSGNTDDQPGFGISSYTGDRTYRQPVERHR